MEFVAVCGGRDFADKNLMDRVLASHVTPDDVIVHGGARGADSLARGWAEANFCQAIEIPAQWLTFGRGAGPRRNAVIAALPLRLVIAFAGGVGTADMTRKARAKGIEVMEVKS